MYTLPALPYAYDALEPYIDTRTMEIHYTRHHQAYINNLNALIEKHLPLQKKSVEDLLINLTELPQETQTGIRSNGGGTCNHTLFWQCLSPRGGTEPNGTLAAEIKKTFGSLESFKEQFNTTAKTVFGSGWTWLIVEHNGKLAITASANQDSPLSIGQKPIIGLDVWEHAYYLQYQNRRPDYINAWWHVLNWDFAEEQYRKTGI